MPRSSTAVSRARWRIGFSAACSALLVAGCGGSGDPAREPIARSAADQLAARSDRVAALLEQGDRCGADREAEALRQRTIAAVNGGQIPAQFQEELQGTVNDLAERISCPPPSPSPPAAPPPAPPSPPATEGTEEKGKGKGAERGRGKGKDGKDNGDQEEREEQREEPEPEEEIDDEGLPPAEDQEEIPTVEEESEEAP